MRPLASRGRRGSRCASNILSRLSSPPKKKGEKEGGAKKGAKGTSRGKFVDSAAPGQIRWPVVIKSANCRLDRDTRSRHFRTHPETRRGARGPRGPPGFLSVGQLYQTDWSDRLPIKWKQATCYFPTRFWCSEKVDVVLASPCFCAWPSADSDRDLNDTAVSLTWRAELRPLSRCGRSIAIAATFR